MQTITRERAARPVNNDVYDTLGDRWYDADDDPVALLRAEGRLRNPWVDRTLRETFGGSCSVLDLGCGAGFLTNYLAGEGHDVTGIDASSESLTVAARHDGTRGVKYVIGDATRIPFASSRFDAVCAMDLLEHVESPESVVAEAARVLRPGGLFFFHTFNRNALAWLVVIKGVEWFVQNTPKDLHVLRLFVKPRELRSMCKRHGLDLADLHGCAPTPSRAFFRMLRTGIVPRDFAFRFTRGTLLGYTGYAKKRG